MSRCLVVFAHPSPDSLNGAVLERVVRALEGNEVRIRDLHAEGFESRLSLDEKRRHFDPPETKPALASHFDDLTWCDTLVLVHPTWWGQQPAILKGWIDRVWACGVAWELPAGATRLAPRLRARPWRVAAGTAPPRRAPRQAGAWSGSACWV